MRTEFHRERLARGAQRAFDRSLEDALRYAKRKAPGGAGGHLASTGSIERSGPLKAKIVFSAPYAKAQETGAFIKPKHGQRFLRIPIAPKSARTYTGGSVTAWRTVRGVRIPAHPYLRPMARTWPRQLRTELRREAGG
jgi:hypothetical protein